MGDGRPDRARGHGAISDGEAIRRASQLREGVERGDVLVQHWDGEDRSGTGVLLVKGVQMTRTEAKWFALGVALGKPEMKVRVFWRCTLADPLVEVTSAPPRVESVPA